MSDSVDVGQGSIISGIVSRRSGKSVSGRASVGGCAVAVPFRRMLPASGRCLRFSADASGFARRFRSFGGCFRPFGRRRPRRSCVGDGCLRTGACRIAFTRSVKIPADACQHRPPTDPCRSPTGKDRADRSPMRSLSCRRVRRADVRRYLHYIFTIAKRQPTVRPLDSTARMC